MILPSMIDPSLTKTDSAKIGEHINAIMIVGKTLLAVIITVIPLVKYFKLHISKHRKSSMSIYFHLMAIRTVIFEIHHKKILQ